MVGVRIFFLFERHSLTTVHGRQVATGIPRLVLALITWVGGGGWWLVYHHFEKRNRLKAVLSCCRFPSSIPARNERASTFSN